MRIPLLRWLVAPALSPGDTPAERYRKELLIPIAVLGAAASVAGWIVHLEHLRARSWGYALCGLSLGALLLRALALRQLPQEMAAGCFTLVALSTLFTDWGALAVHGAFRSWLFNLPILHIFLAIDAPRRLQEALLGLTAVWVVVTAAQNTFDLGLVGLEGWTDYDPDWSGQRCDCTDPPCSTGSAYFFVTNSVAGVVLLCSSYYAARHFANGLRRERQALLASGHVTEQITELLAAYATDDARRVVAEEGDALPSHLRLSYQNLLDNLDSYRVFLPDSLLYTTQQQQQQQQEQHQDGSPRRSWPVGRPAPGQGAQTARVATCFTDVQSSTELWEARPQGMYEGLRMHDQVMRETYRECGGYEVKTIGDSFMVAFDGALDALRFGLEAQQGLLLQHWPEDLLQHHLCSRSAARGGGPLWGGLRVRIGVECGPTRVQRNPVTGRCDYFGHTVNTAARLEAVLRFGGLVATSEAVASGMAPAELRELGSPVVHEVGPKELKGVKEPVNVFALVPLALRERLAVLEEPPSGISASPSMQDSPSGMGSVPAGVSSIITSPVSSQPSRCSTGASSPGSLKRSRSLSTLSQLTLQLRPRSGTCAAARAELSGGDLAADRLCVFVHAATLAADQTQGVVDVVLSACVFASWNAARPCSDHTAACRQFLGARFRTETHLGAASGGVLCGGIAAGRRSYAAVAGGCVELAAGLAEEAELCGDSALAAGAVGEACVAVGTAFCAQLWQALGSPAMVVYEVRTVEDERWLLEDFESPHATLGRVRWASGAALPALFLAACSGGPGSAAQEEALRELRGLQAAAPQGGVHPEHLRNRILRGQVRTRPMPPLWEPNPAAAPSAATASPRGPPQEPAAAPPAIVGP